MNRLSKTAIVCILCAVFCLSGVLTAFAIGNDKAKGSVDVALDLDDAFDTQSNDGTDVTTSDLSQDETVYVFSGSNGDMEKVVVSDKVKDALESSGNNGDSSIVFDAQGNSVGHSGNVEKDLPIGIKVSYKLDGKKISADKLAGKSGKLTIRFDYTNNHYENVNINGKTEKIYVPFATVTGMLLDDEVFKNVKVSNGKVAGDGEHTLVIGLALPGMQENLGVGKKKIDVPDHVEITADVTDLKMGMSITVATNEPFKNIDKSKLDSVDGIEDSIKELEDGMNQLLDGSSQLYEGLTTLRDKSGELSDGTAKLASGANDLQKGAATLESGADQINSGANELSLGLNTLKSNNDSLNGGAKQVFQALLSTAETQIKAAGLSVPSLTINNYSSVLNGILDTLDENKVYQAALAQVTAAVEENRPLIESKVTDVVRSQVEAQVTAAVKAQVTEKVTAAVKEQVSEQVISAAAGMSKSDYEAAVAAGMIPQETQDQISAAIDAQMGSDAVVGLINSNIDAQMQTSDVKAAIKSNTDAQMQTDTVKKTISDNVEIQVQQAISQNMASDEVQAKLAAASEGAKSIISLKASLDSYNAFYLGLMTYTNGVASAADGAAKLASGTSDLKAGTTELKNGSTELYNGILQVNNATPALIDGVSKLTDGSKELDDGLNKFNEEGIQKIVDLAQGDLKDISSRLKATADVSKNYHGISGISEDIADKINFIYRTAEIE